MKEYKLLFDKKFQREYKKLDRSLQIEGDKKVLRLRTNPKEIGKPLKYFPNLYELYLREYRIYYVIEESQIKVLLIKITHKDKQDKFLRQLTKERIKQILEENR
jgi:mRNA-degrading endonuclease RelE of RelBE toxin-antitoxin system